MSLTRRIFALAFSCALLGGATPSQGALSGLFNTGVDSSGVVLGNGALDPHYALTFVPSGSNQAVVRTAIGGFPIGPWVGDDTASAWIGPNNDSQLNGPFGLYYYYTEFTLSASDVAGFTLGGVWATDNEGVDILINGVSTGNNIPSTGDANSFANFHAFSIASGFQAGTNSLEFIINNGYSLVFGDNGGNSNPGPTGLRVEFVFPAGPAAGVIPEPASFAVWSLLGFCVVTSCGRCRRR